MPGLAALNMPDVPAVAQVIARALGQLGGGKPSRVSLVIPDTVAKVSLLKLEKVPAKAAGPPGDRALADSQDRAVPDRAGAS